MARIIIVEDEAIIADEIQMMLELMGHEVVANIQNGDRALDRKSTRLNSSHVRTSRMPSSA